MQPLVGLWLGLRLVEVIERFVGFLDAAEGTFDFSLGSRGGSISILACGNVCLPLDVEGQHHILKYPALGYRPVVQIDHLGSALEGKRRILLGCHGVEQEAQRGLRIFAVDAAVLLVVHAAAIIDHTEQHQCWLAFGRVYPCWRFDVLEIRWRHIELPAIVAEFGLEANRRRFAAQSPLV